MISVIYCLSKIELFGLKFSELHAKLQTDFGLG